MALTFAECCRVRSILCILEFTISRDSAQKNHREPCEYTEFFEADGIISIMVNRGEQGVDFIIIEILS